jgi:hypothetical protein
VWKQIISAALGDNPREVDYAFRGTKCSDRRIPGTAQSGLLCSIGSSAAMRAALRRTSEAVPLSVKCVRKTLSFDADGRDLLVNRTIGVSAVRDIDPPLCIGRSIRLANC